MAAPYIPTRESELVTWSNNFDTLILASAATFGLTPTQATDYDALHTAFVSAYQAASDPSTRTPSAIVAKNEAKDALVAEARQLSQIVQADPSVTNKLKSDLGLTVRDTEPSPVPVPEVAPSITIEQVLGRTVKIRLRDVENPDRRGKPDGVIGATIFYFVGEDPPADPSTWSFAFNATKTLLDIDFPSTVAAGTKVWITAFWFNTKAQSSPAAAAVSTRFADGMAQAA